MGRTVAVALACLAGLGASPGPATAHDHRPPRAVLVSGAEEQKGKPLHSAWLSRADRRFCDFKTRRALPSFPRPLRHAAGDTVRIVLHSEAAPLEIEVEAWRRVGSTGRPAGTAEPVPAVLTPVVQGTQAVAWEVTFVPPPAAPHVYLALEAYWADEEGCAQAPDVGSQSAAWTFHLAGDA